MPNFLLVILGPLIGQFHNHRKPLLKKELIRRVTKRNQTKFARSKVLVSLGGYYTIIFDWAFAIHSIFNQHKSMETAILKSKLERFVGGNASPAEIKQIDAWFSNGNYQKLHLSEKERKDLHNTI